MTNGSLRFFIFFLDKADPGSSSPADVSSMRSVYSEGGDSSHAQQCSVSFPSPNSSHSTGESIRLPLSATVKEENVISLDTQDDSQQQTDTDYGDRLQDSMSLGLDTSTSYANNSQGAMDDTSQSAMAAGYMSQFKVINHFILFISGSSLKFLWQMQACCLMCHSQ